MADEVKNNEQVTDVNNQNNGATVEQGQQVQGVTIDQFETLKQTLDKVSKNYDRLNSDYQKKQKELEDERKKSMSAQELEDMKRRENEDKLRILEKELNEKTLAFEKTQLISSKQLDPDFIALVQGSNIEEFKLNVEKLNEKFNQVVEKRVNEKLAQANPVPQSQTVKTDDIYSADEFQKISKDRKLIAANYDKYMKSYSFYMKK